MNDADAARRARLNHGLAGIAEWARKRTEGNFNVNTTLTMLGKKVKELESAVTKVGQKTINETGKTS